MNKIITITVALFYTLSILSCSDSDHVEIEPDDVDRTTSCQSGDESGRFHTFFKPPVGWFGDPFPFYDNGTFYIYYLQDWRGAHPYLHPFHLVTTTDISAFTYEGEVLSVGPASAQDAALCTGSIIKSRENGFYYMFYAGHKSNNDPATPLQAVMLAVSTDLKHWTKDDTFSLFINESGYNRNDFRDPFVYFDEETHRYKMLVTTQHNGRGTLALYISEDLYHWELQEPFHMEPNTAILECADLFKEGDWWYLVYSDIHDRKVHYKYSSSPEGPWITPTHSTFDGIAYYAGKTASDGTSRYLFGWCPTRIGDGVEDQWGGSLVTHLITSQANGTLKVAVPPAMDNKFIRKTENLEIKQSGSVTKSGESYVLQGEANVTFPRISSARKIVTTIKASVASNIFGLVFGACDVSNEQYAILFDPARNKLSMYRDVAGTKELQTEVYLPVPDQLTFKVKVIVEKSVCVVYVNNEIAFTNRITPMNQNPWMICTEKGEVKFSDVQVYREYEME